MGWTDPGRGRFWRSLIPLEDRTVCVNALTQLTISHDGLVGFCCLYADDSGDRTGVIGDDLRRESLTAIVNGDRRREVVAAMFRHDWDSVPYCARCPDWHDYVRERERIAAEHGSSEPEPIDL